jgi:hypothetical protein
MCRPDLMIWRVVRLDDNGNRFEVARGLASDTAEQVIRNYEHKGHKQTYVKELETCVKP